MSSSFGQSLPLLSTGNKVDNEEEDWPSFFFKQET
jgi:hypothetical protein